MAVSLQFYLDAGLTAPATGLTVAQASDGSSAAIDRVVYLGSTVAAKQFQAASNPGVDPISLSIADSASGSGVEAAHVKLATSAVGLDSAVAGAPLALGTAILSGVANAVPVHLRIDTPALAEGVYSDVGLLMTALIELAA